MWMENIRRGVLAVQTEASVRYIQLSLFERVLLAWTFRNFHALPEPVLNRYERKLLDAVCRKGRYVANWNGHGDLSEICIGRVERVGDCKPPLVETSQPEVRHRTPATGTILPRVS